jgi:ribonuclease HI
MNEWWTMYFDGVANISGNGAGALIISLQKKQYLVSVKLSFKCTKNTVEYEACIIGLEDALELKVEKLDVYGDSMLIIRQVKGKCVMPLAESIFFNLRVKLKKIKT